MYNDLAAGIYSRISLRHCQYKDFYNINQTEITIDVPLKVIISKIQ